MRMLDLINRTLTSYYTVKFVVWFSAKVVVQWSRRWETSLTISHKGCRNKDQRYPLQKNNRGFIIVI